jgi:hypothetical protein
MMSNIELIVCRIFKEIIGDDTWDSTILAIFYVLYNYHIYFVDADPDDYPLELTYRGCAANAAYIASGVYREWDYVFWMTQYSDEFRNPHELPDKYVEKVEKLLNALKAHPYVNRVIKGFDDPKFKT